MRINTKSVWQFNADIDDYELISCEGYEYEGDVALAFGGRSRQSSATTTSQDIDTTNVGIEGVEGVGIAAAGDVEFSQQVTDLGAVQGAFDFTTEFADDAFSFANDVARQAGETAARAVDVSQRALSTVVTGGATDLAGINQKTLIGVALAVGAALAAFQLARSN